ncbi:hypothetical protein R3P38DRAFT_3095416 [Favolaschia claudopus]|uniref:Uncharacterized protein n=1 Tax=Favolaschia claudopus TaxID=2862362 RepID=A0AAV9ZQU4_9AGAR
MMQHEYPDSQPALASPGSTSVISVAQPTPQQLYAVAARAFAEAQNAFSAAASSSSSAENADTKRIKALEIETHELTAERDARVRECAALRAELDALKKSADEEKVDLRRQLEAKMLEADALRDDLTQQKAKHRHEMESLQIVSDRRLLTLKAREKLLQEQQVAARSFIDGFLTIQDKYEKVDEEANSQAVLGANIVRKLRSGDESDENSVRLAATPSTDSTDHCPIPAKRPRTESEATSAAVTPSRRLSNKITTRMKCKQVSQNTSKQDAKFCGLGADASRPRHGPFSRHGPFLGAH